MLAAERPPVAARPTTGGLERQEDLADVLVADRRRHRHATGRRGRQIPAHRLRIEAELGGDSVLRQARAAEPKHFSDFDQRDLAIQPRLLAWGTRPRTGDLYRAVRRKGGKVLKNSRRKGGKLLKNLSPKGGMVLKKSSGKGP